MSSIEGSQWPSDKSESSSEEDKDAKDKKNKKAPNSRWVHPPLLRRESLFSPNQRNDPAEAPLRPPIPLEKLDNNAETDDDEDEENTSPVEVAPPEPSANSEFMDIPLMEDAEQPTPTFEEILQREMPSEFVGATSGPELGNPEAVETPPLAPPWEAASEQSIFDRSQEDDTTPTAAKPSGGSTLFSRPTPSESTTSSTAGGASSVGEAMAGSSFSTALEALRTAADIAELANNPYRMVTRAITETAILGYLTERKQHRYEGLEQQLHQRDEQHIYDQEGNEIVLQLGERIERSAGGYIAVMKGDRVVHDRIRYGNEFKHDLQREQVSDDVFTAIDNGASITSLFDDITVVNSQAPSTTPPTQQTPGVQSNPTVDLKHRLPKPKSPMATAASSPWLWTAIAVLIIIYFIAALA